MESNLQQFDKLKANLQLHVSKIKPIKIEQPEQQIEVTTQVRDLKSRLKEVENLRVALVKPHNDHVKSINDYARDLKEMLDGACKPLEGSLLSWNRVLLDRRAAEEARIRAEQEEKRVAAQKALDEAKRNAEFEASLGLQDQAEETKLVAAVQAETAEKRFEKEAKKELKAVAEMKVKGVKTRWDFDIVDPDKIPREFLVIDTAKIRKVVTEMKDKTNISGIRPFSIEGF